ncbi:hypothetical protein IAD21_04307 [Abditibacteriota bacterium]|nr:hypothetical protein IAD21_04307 [Abditibacteriota bacterium]
MFSSYKLPSYLNLVVCVFSLCVWIGLEGRSANAQNSMFPAPQGLVVHSGNASASLVWAQVKGATSYKIFASKSSRQFPTTPTLSTNRCSATISKLPNGTPTYFVVKACNGKNDGLPSSPVLALPIAFPPPPSQIGASGQVQCITVKWNRVGDASSYLLFRSTTSNGYGRYLTRLEGRDSTIYKDTLARPGMHYFYVVRSINASGQSLNSSETGAIAAAPSPTPTLTPIPIPVVSVTNPIIDEGQSGTSALVFLVSLSKASSRTFTFDYTTKGGTATPDADFAPISGTMTIPAGSSKASVAVTVYGDTQFEGNETIVLGLSNFKTEFWSNSLSTLNATGTIRNDDKAPTPTPVPTAIPQVTATPTPLPTVTPEPTATPTPTITINDSSVLVAGRDYPAFDLSAQAPSRFFSFSSARVAQAGPSAPCDWMVAGIQNTNLGDIGTLVASWTSNAPILELPLYSYYGTLKLTVDGTTWINAHQKEGSTPFAMPPNDASIKMVRIDWTQSGGRRLRHYRAEVGGFFGGARVGENDSFTAASDSKKLRIAFVGDSYTEGIGANTVWEGFAAICAHELGAEAILLGSGGTGYLHIPYEGRFPFIDRLGDLKSLNPIPDVIVVAGGINDNAYSDEERYNAESSYFEALKTNFPRAKILIIGPWNPLRHYADSRADALKGCALGHGLPFVDVRDWLPPLNTPAYIGSDNIHPTPLGHEYLGLRIASELKPFIPN